MPIRKSQSDQIRLMYGCLLCQNKLPLKRNWSSIPLQAIVASLTVTPHVVGTPGR